MDLPRFITFISDYGNGSHYTAALKGCIWSQLPSARISEIHSGLKLGDIRHAAFILNASAYAYPEQSIHLIAVECSPVKYPKLGVLFHKGQYFIAFDNGIFQYLTHDASSLFYTFDTNALEHHVTFAELNWFPHLIHLIHTNQLSQETLSELPEIASSTVESIDRLTGNVMFIDGNHNIISDIRKELFYSYLTRFKRFAIYYRGKGNISRIHQHYNDDILPGETVAFFNHNDLLEIAQTHGNASSLLGVKTGDRIIIEFYDK